MSEQLHIHKGLYEDGFAPVEIDISYTDLHAAMDSYQDFLKTDEAIHRSTTFNASGRGDGNFGQFERVAGEIGPRGVIPDNKDVFHFGSQTRQRTEADVSGKLPREAKTFFDQTEEIFWAGQRAKRRALEELDWLSTGLVKVMMPKTYTNNDVLRFIAYHDNEAALAEAHFDKGVCTLAVGESHEGLRLAKAQNGLVLDVTDDYIRKIEQNLTPVEHRSGEAKFFLGAGWNRLPHELRAGNHDLELAYHDVIQSQKRVSQAISRWAIVMFCNPYLEFQDYTLPTQPETRPYKQLGRIAV